MFHAEMDDMNKSLKKVAAGGSSPFTFTFVPLVQKLPVERIICEEERSGGLTGRRDKNLSVSHEKTSRETTSGEDIFKVEKVFIKDSVEGGAGNMAQPRITEQLQLLLDVSPYPSVIAQAENTPRHVTAGTTVIETAADQHKSPSQRQCCDIAGLSDVSSDFFANNAPVSEERTSPTSSAGILTPIASSRESILSEGSDKEKRWSTMQPSLTHKIKLSYKSLAAIPTNTLLLDQQVIDEQVERGDTVDRGVTLDITDTHAEMCSPAQLRQQSEELYATIDEILANSIPTTPQHSRTPTPIPGLQQNSSSSLKSLGRETKYASLCSLHPSTNVERNHMSPKKTKPGVIRPMTAIPRLRVEDEDRFQPRPVRHFDIKPFSDNKKVLADQDFHTSSTQQGLTDKWKPEKRAPFSLCDLQITEPDDKIGPPSKDASFTPPKS